MEYLTSYCTDVGISKKTNQDALLIKIADSSKGKIAFAAVCDGMGGLKKGELASAEVIRRMSDWFDFEFGEMLFRGFDGEQLKRRWDEIVMEENEKLAAYGKCSDIQLGTTLSAILIVDSQYYIVHIGDSRIYEVTDQVFQLTTDQTVTAREVAKGTMTEEQARTDARRNVLLQCIGASALIEPEYKTGAAKCNAVYLLCTDGFRHEIGNNEIWDYFAPDKLKDVQIMEDHQIFLTNLVKERMEQDNITVALLRTY